MTRTLTGKVSPLMCVLAVVIARDWIRSQSEGDLRNMNSPTPAQYSLLIGMILSANISAFWTSLSYSFKSKRAPITSIYQRTFIFLVFALVFSHAIGVLDFFFHIKSSSEIIQFTSPDFMEPLPFGRELNLTACVSDLDEAVDRACQVNIGPMDYPAGWGNNNLLLEGGLTASNLSKSNYVTSLPSMKNTHIAVLLSPPADHYLQYKASSVGLGAYCFPVDPSKCNLTTPWKATPGVTFSCEAPWGLDISSDYLPVPGNAPITYLDSVYQEDDLTRIGFAYGLTNPLPIWAKIVYSSSEDVNDSESTAPMDDCLHLLTWSCRFHISELLDPGLSRALGHVQSHSLRGLIFPSKMVHTNYCPLPLDH
jgi:hypothetical protein